MLKINDLKKIFPKRLPGTNKGDYGKAFVLAGSEGMIGAAILCGRAAIRSGAGLVFLDIPKKYETKINLSTPEIIIQGNGTVNRIAEAVQRMDALAIGPGLGERRKLVRPLLSRLSREKFTIPLILDADGINAFAGKGSQLSKLKLKMILTPHPGEMARLIGKSISEIQKRRQELALAVAKYFNCIVVLKGHGTVVADNQGKLFVNRTGNPGMATAGTGDVLTGMIVSFAAQGLSAWEAAVAGVYLHGKAGDLAAKEKGEYGMIASDIIEKIPYAIRKIN